MLQTTLHDHVLYAAQTVVLDSSVGMRQVCPGETVTYTCIVNQGFALEWIVEPFISGNDPIRFLLDTTPIRTSVDCSDRTPPQCDNFDFVTTFTSITSETGGLADMTSTLTFNATVRLNGTVVQCQGTTAVGFPITNRTLNVIAAGRLCCSI